MMAGGKSPNVHRNYDLAVAFGKSDKEAVGPKEKPGRGPGERRGKKATTIRLPAESIEADDVPVLPVVDLGIESRPARMYLS
jgi:hypothetical protein